jgi:hypothetical protein
MDRKSSIDKQTVEQIPIIDFIKRRTSGKFIVNQYQNRKFIKRNKRQTSD